MIQSDIRAGVSAMSLYVPRFRVRLEDWCSWTGNSWDKVQTVVGRSFRVCGEHENVYTMAANAVLRLILQNQIDPSQVGFLGFGTESSTDNSAGAIIIRGMVDRALDKHALPRLSRNLEVPEFKHACLAGIYALKSAIRFVMTDGALRKAVVVCGDVAEYERGSTGEQTQGAGAVAMLIENQPRLFEIDLRNAGTSSDYRGPDFRKPFARHFTDEYAQRTSRMSDFPIFSGRYSTFAYIDETAHAVENLLEKLGVSAGKYYRSVRGLFFHRPYNQMPIQAMSFLYVRGMARGVRHHDELRELCQEADIPYDQVIKESRSAPDLYAQVVVSGQMVDDPYPGTNAVAAVLRRRSSFRELLAEKVSLGSNMVMHLGNLYSAALPAWLAAGFEEAEQKGIEIADAPMVAIGYGSGDAAEAIPISPVKGWQEAAKKINLKQALADPIDLRCQQYEALHDGRELVDLEYVPKQEFVISHVGGRYERGFQDLAVEYYDYVL
jgi:hydroxymethylglutaryl-CoA synthase